MVKKTGLLNSLITGFLISLMASGHTCATNRETWVTVFVHGIMSIKPHVSFSNFLRFMTDDIHHTVYSKTVELMRCDQVFYQNQAMQGLGLKQLNPALPAKGNASNVLALAFEKIEEWVNPNKNYTSLYYTYGWSGLLSPQQRYLDALHFYKELAQHLALVREQYPTVKVRIIGYSHGGNICLNLAQAAQQYPDLPTFTIDELFLLGMPVQYETDYLIEHPIFKKIYHIYSRGDRIQKLDFFSFDRFFSRRVFKKRRGFCLPDKLIQIQLKCTRNVQYSSCKANSCKRVYHFADTGLIGGKSRFLRDASPGHTELWFFGWTPGNYRRTFPLYPLPVVAFIPLIIKAVECFEEHSLFEKPTLIDIRPEHEIVLIKNQKSKRILTIMPFLSANDFDDIKQEILRYMPDNYTQYMYNSRIQASYTLAAELHKEEWKEKIKRKRETKDVKNQSYSVAEPAIPKCQTE